MPNPFKSRNVSKKDDELREMLKGSSMPNITDNDSDYGKLDSPKIIGSRKVKEIDEISIGVKPTRNARNLKARQQRSKARLDQKNLMTFSQLTSQEGKDYQEALKTQL